jgi:tetratricopeptide (TPR) repeat protein
MAKKTAAAAQPGPKKETAAAEERRPTAEDRFAEFSARYKWYFFVPILIAVGAAIVLGIAAQHRRSHQRAARAAYQAAGTLEQFEAVAAKYPDSFVGRRALVKAGDLLYNQGKYAEARDKYAAYLATKPDPALGMPVRMAVVQTYIAEKDYAAAIGMCKEILGTKGREFVETQAIYYMGYCHELSGDLEAAKVEYQKIGSASETQGAWSMLAQQRLDELTRRIAAREKKPQKDVDTPVND